VRWVVVVLLVLGVVVALGWGFQRRLVYLPSGVVPAPAAAGLPEAQPVGVDTADGLTLGAWFVPAADGGQPQAAVLVCHGNGGDRADRAALARELSRRGMAVLLFDYRGYGGNPGSPSEAGLLADARAARAALAERAGDAPLVYFGESLGAAVATALAVEDPPSALVLRSPFASLAEVARVHYPFVPELLLRDRYPVTEQVARVEAPVLVVAGDADRTVPPEQSRAVADAAGVPLVLLPGADHNDRVFLDGRAFLDEIDAFLARTR
jgi:fermentation-respiration switch protein FrsA (DUF1100 family)